MATRAELLKTALEDLDESLKLTDPTVIQANALHAIACTLLAAELRYEDMPKPTPAPRRFIERDKVQTSAISWRPGEIGAITFVYDGNNTGWYGVTFDDGSGCVYPARELELIDPVF